jgi:hypothetical protein
MWMRQTPPENLRPIAATNRGDQVTITNEEAQLVVQLASWGTSLGVEESLAELFSERFDATDGTADNASVRNVLWYFEMVGTLSKRGALSADLANDLWWLSGIWDRVKSHVDVARTGSGEPRLYENFEFLVTSFSA